MCNVGHLYEQQWCIMWPAGMCMRAAGKECMCMICIGMCVFSQIHVAIAECGSTHYVVVHG